MGGFGTVNERLEWPHQNSCPVGPFYNPAGDIYSLFCLLVGIRELTELHAWAPKPVLCMSTSPISLQSILSRHFCSRSCRKHIQLPLLTGLAQAQRLSPKHPGLSGGITAGTHPHSPYTRSATYHRCFRWGYPQTLRQDACKVGGPGSVPQQPPIVKLLEGLVALALSLTLYLKDLCVSKREAETL